MKRKTSSASPADAAFIKLFFKAGIIDHGTKRRSTKDTATYYKFTKDAKAFYKTL